MEPQSNVCLGMEGKVCPWPRGKALGGTSVINYMIYTRGNKGDFDRLAANGNTGWDAATVLKYYKKSEITSLENDLLDEEYHGADDIPVRVAAPVGQNMYDHLAYFGSTVYLEKQYENFFHFLNPGVWLEWLTRGSGPLTALALSVKSNPITHLGFVLSIASVTS